MKDQLNLPIGNGFYLMPHSLVTRDGVCMPMFRRVRDDSLYVVTAETCNKYQELNNHDIAATGVCDIKDALEEGSIAYYTTESVPLIPYHELPSLADEDYILFAVRVCDLFFSQSRGYTMVCPDKRLHFVENHFTRETAPDINDNIMTIETITYEFPDKEQTWKQAADNHYWDKAVVVKSGDVNEKKETDDGHQQPSA